MFTKERLRTIRCPWLAAGKSRGLVVGLALILLAAAIYRGVLELPFVYDDGAYLLDSPRMLGGVTADAVRWAFSSFHHANWQPLAVVSALLDIQLFGRAPAGHHVVNLLIHLGNVALLFHLLRVLAGDLWRPALVTAIFALHPLNVEAVAWVTERSMLLCTFFGLLALLAYRRYAAAPAAGRLALVAVLFALCLLSKPMLVAFPLLLLLLDYWPLGRDLPRRWVGLIREKIPLFLLAASDVIVTYQAQTTAGAVQSLESHPLGSRIANAVTAYAAYLRQAFWPTDLAVFYPYRGISIPRLEIVAAVALLLAVSVFALRARRRRPYLIVGWCWYLVLLLPTIGLVQVGWQARADRYTYVPLLGIFLALSWVLADLSGTGRLRRTLAAAGAMLAVAALALLTSAQVAVWRDEITLFGHAVRVTAENKVAQNNLGAALVERGNYAEAAAHFREALRIAPSYADAYAGLGQALGRSGRLDDGIGELREALRLKPDSTEFRVNLGNVLAEAGRTREAEELYREALRRRPDQYLTHLNLANLLADDGHLDAALDHYAAATRLDPEALDIRFDHGVALAEHGRFAEAEAVFREALRIRPDDQDLRRGLAALGRRAGSLPPAPR